MGLVRREGACDSAHLRRACGTRRGDLGRHAEMPEDPADHGGLFDQRDQAQAATTPRTCQHIEPEAPLHQRRPTLATRSVLRRLRRVSLTGLRRERLCYAALATAVWRRTSAGRRAARGPSTP